MKIFKNKIVITVLVISTLLKLILSLSTFHPDLAVFHLSGRLVGSGNFFNLYDYLDGLESNHPLKAKYPGNLFIYPPLVYLYFGTIPNSLVSVFPDSFQQTLIYDLPSVLGNSSVNLLLLLFKLPYLLFDIGIAFLLTKFFTEEKKKILAFAIWLFNPISIYATYMMGQFDIIPAFFSLLALILVLKTDRFKNFVLAALVLGIGASFKIYPLLFLFPLALLRPKWQERLSVLGVGFTTYFFLLLPFLGSVGFRSSALVAGQTLKSFYAAIPISGGESILLYPAFLLFFYLLFYFSKTSAQFLWKRFFLILLLFFIFTHYHPQWFLWITPFLILDLVISNFKHWPLVLLTLISFIGLLFFFDSSLTWGIFAPINPVLQYISQPVGIPESVVNTTTARSILQSVFVGVGLYYIFNFFKQKPLEEL